MLNPYIAVESLPFFVVTILSFILMYHLASVGRRIGLVDRPDGRKRHDDSVPLVGGISIAIAVFLSAMLAPFGLSEFRYLFFCLGVLIVVGVLDDAQDISPGVKFLAQFGVATILVIWDGSIVANIGDIFSWNDGNRQGLGRLTYPLTIVAIVGVINAFNMVDGHDGVASTIFLITAGSLLLLCNFNDSWKYQYILAIFFCSVAVHLLFNIGIVGGKSHQIFLGDAGSMFLGLVVVYMLINLSKGDIPVVKTASAPWLIGIPLLDMFSVIILRIVQNKSPFRADRQHIHHFLTGKGFSKSRILATLVTAHFGFCAIGVVGTRLDVPDWQLFWTMFVVYAMYLSWAYRKIKTFQ